MEGCNCSRIAFGTAQPQTCFIQCFIVTMQARAGLHGRASQHSDSGTAFDARWSNQPQRFRIKGLSFPAQTSASSQTMTNLRPILLSALLLACLQHCAAAAAASDDGGYLLLGVIETLHGSLPVNTAERSGLLLCTFKTPIDHHIDLNVYACRSHCTTSSEVCRLKPGQAGVLDGCLRLRLARRDMQCRPRRLTVRPCSSSCCSSPPFTTSCLLAPRSSDWQSACCS